MDDLIYSYAENKDMNKLLGLCENSAEGVELYTFLKVNKFIPDYTVWCGKNKEGNIKSLIFNDGDRNILSYGTALPAFLKKDESIIMIYKGGKVLSCAGEIPSENIKEVYMLLSGTDFLSFDNNNRCEFRKKSVIKGLAHVFGIYENDRLVSTASVSAENKKYAFVADVFTNPEKRKKGYAKKCVLSAVSSAVAEEKIPLLRCRKNMCDYYGNIGFVRYENL